MAKIGTSFNFYPAKDKPSLKELKPGRVFLLAPWRSYVDPWVERWLKDPTRTKSRVHYLQEPHDLHGIRFRVGDRIIDFGGAMTQKRRDVWIELNHVWEQSEYQPKPEIAHVFDDPEPAPVAETDIEAVTANQHGEMAYQDAEGNWHSLGKVTSAEYSYDDKAIIATIDGTALKDADGYTLTLEKLKELGWTFDTKGKPDG